MAVPMSLGALLAAATGRALSEEEKKKLAYQERQRQLLSNLLQTAFGERARLEHEKQFGAFRESLPSTKAEVGYRKAATQNLLAGAQQKKELLPYEIERAKQETERLKKLTELEGQRASYYPKLSEAEIRLREAQRQYYLAMADFRRKASEVAGLTQSGDNLGAVTKLTSAFSSLARLFVPGKDGTTPYDLLPEQARGVAIGLMTSAGKALQNELARTDPEAALQIVAAPLYEVASSPDKIQATDIVRAVTAVFPELVYNQDALARVRQTVEATADELIKSGRVKNEKDAYRAIALDLYHRIRSMRSYQDLVNDLRQTLMGQPGAQATPSPGLGSGGPSGSAQ